MFSRFRWMVFPFLSIDDSCIWETALGVPGSAPFMDTPLCLPICPLHCHFHSCGRDVTSIYQTHRHAGLLILYWVWPLLLVHNHLGWVCTILNWPLLPHNSMSNDSINVFQTYTKLGALVCHCSIGYLHHVSPLPPDTPHMHKCNNGIMLLKFDFWLYMVDGQDLYLTRA